MSSDLVLQEGVNDVILKVRHGGLSWRIPAHSVILTSKSSKFREMLDERTGEEKPTPLLIVDMHPETAVAVLKYIYEGEFPTDVTADLLIAAKNYRLESLRDNLEIRLKEDMTVLQACEVLETLNSREPTNSECSIKQMCLSVLRNHALIVFGSDIIMSLSKTTLCMLLACDRLNIPDDAYLFWGIWRWGRQGSSMMGRSTTDKDVALYIDDLIVLIRKSSLKNKFGIPSVAFARFDSCKCRRSLYACPEDIMKHSSPIRPCPAWEDIVAPKRSEAQEGPVGIQLSVEKDLLLVGFSLEMSAYHRIESYIRIIRETDSVEVRLQEIDWTLSSMRKLSSRGDPESRMEAEVVLQKPFFLIPGNIYSVQLVGNFSECHFVWGSFGKRRMKIGNSFVHFHGHGVTTIREIHVIPDVSVTWGSRGIVV